MMLFTIFFVAVFAVFFFMTTLYLHSERIWRPWGEVLALGAAISFALWFLYMLIKNG